MDVVERFKGEFEAIEFDVARKTQEAIAAATADKDAQISALQEQVAALQSDAEKARDEGREEGGRSAIDEIKRRLGIL